MRKQKSETSEYTPNWDSGTYQTGSTTPPKEHRGLIALLMILVTFLGGLASALGLINIRLVQELAKAEIPTDTVAIYQDPTKQDLPTAPEDVPAPSVPKTDGLNFQIVDHDNTGKTISLEEILSISNDSLVTIHCGNWETDSQICGVVIDEMGYILTNAYPISDSSHIFVTLADGRCGRAALVGTDEFTDLAVLYVDLPGLTAAQFATADNLQAGDFALHISADRYLTEGSICCADFSYTISTQNLQLLETDLAGSAGPIYNNQGQIIGFTSRYFHVDGHHLAIPSVIVKDVAQQIIANGFCIGRPCIGAQIEEVQKLYQHYWKLPSGIRITDVHSQSATFSGLEPGDIIICLGGQTITDRASLCAVLRTLHTGTQVEAVVLRGNQQITLLLTIGAFGE